MRSGFTLLFLLVAATALMIFTSMTRAMEGFYDASAPRCGVNMPPCGPGMACVNGYCNRAAPPKIPEYTGLPVYPIGR